VYPLRAVEAGALDSPLSGDPVQSPFDAASEHRQHSRDRNRHVYLDGVLSTATKFTDHADLDLIWRLKSLLLQPFRFLAARPNAAPHTRQHGHWAIHLRVRRPDAEQRGRLPIETAAAP